MRETLEYIAVSTDASQTCVNCQFYRGHKHQENTACGECELLSGAVESGGYCTSWALKS
jgi:High potential iron-sulfur protein